MPDPPDDHRYPAAIRRRELTIYDVIEPDDPEAWIPRAALESLLDDRLHNLSLKGLPLRTRSKVVRAEVCRALGYPVPDAFRRTRPRFPGQGLDVYVQKSDNLQIWNEDLDADRRYAIVRVSDDDLVTRVRVVSGASLAKIDTSRALTRKYQARLTLRGPTSELVSPVDTRRLHPLVGGVIDRATDPAADPQLRALLPISVLYERLLPLVDSSFPSAGNDQERNRGAALHRRVCQALGYREYRDDGQFPDVRHQLLEVKLQTEQTIDLGLVRPNSQQPFDVPRLAGRRVRHCDVRYAIFCARMERNQVTVTHLFVTTGEDFCDRFPQLQGQVLNQKQQIRLPNHFFDR